MERSLVVYIAMSLDGYIAAPNDDLSFLSSVEQEGEDYGYTAFLNSVDTVILGRKTYDKVISMGVEAPHADKTTYVITRTAQAAKGNTQFYTSDVEQLVKQLKAQSGKTIFCDGGAQIVNLLLEKKLVDQIIVSIIPVLLGQGVRLFNDQGKTQTLQLVNEKAFEKGLVQLHYKVVKV